MYSCSFSSLRPMQKSLKYPFYLFVNDKISRALWTRTSSIFSWPYHAQPQWRHWHLHMKWFITVSWWQGTGCGKIDSLPLCSPLTAFRQTAALQMWLPLLFCYPNNRVIKLKDRRQSWQANSPSSGAGARVTPKQPQLSPLVQTLFIGELVQGQRRSHLNIKQGFPLHSAFAFEYKL